MRKTNLLKNKKGSTLQNWTEGIIIGMLFVVIFSTVVITEMNNTYNKTNEVVGLDTSTVQSSINEYQSSMSDKIKGGEVSFLSAVGMTLSTSWDVIVSTLNLIWQFISGEWIHTIVIDYMHLPYAVALILQSLYFLSIGFIILRVLFKVKV